MAKKKSEDDSARSTIQVDSAAKDAFKAVCEERPVKRSMQDVGTSLVWWFVRQPAKVRAAIANDVDEDMEKPYAEALRKLAGEIERGERPLRSLDAREKPPGEGEVNRGHGSKGQAQRPGG